MKKFRLVDNVLGWMVFAIAAITYCLTIEPTASFWDCPEFITTGYKLEVGHPPGAPFFMLTANLFSQFTSDVTQIARMVNTMSALLSATCILFLFWSITHLVRKLLVRDISEMTLTQMISIEASGIVGALIYTFSDTFWFSAVEAEVYAYSSAFTAIVFWLILKWEDHADEPHSDRWLVLITYMTGLSIGVHLLNLLCVPAIVLVYYYRRFPNATLKGSLAALGISFVIVAAILYGVVPGIITVGGWFELFFVNTLGMPFNSGTIIYLLLLISVVIWAIWETYSDHSQKRQNIAYLASVGMLGIPFYGYGWGAFFIGLIVLAGLAFVLFYKYRGKNLITTRFKNTTLLCMLMLMIGYSTYAVIVIRSAANPPMDQNSPEDIFTLGSYLSRDQYGYRPLFYGQAYTSEVKRDSKGYPVESGGAPIYQRKEKASPDEKDRYFIVDYKKNYVFEQNMFFPRMYDPGHAESYESWMGGINGRIVAGQWGDNIKIPTQFENLQFFLSYQCNFMYWRYFMWNFAGRQNDMQGNGELEYGNWLTGFKPIDNLRLGDQDMLPDDLKNNKGHNVYYCLPLLLGLIGLFWQAFYQRKRKITVDGKTTEEVDPVGIRQFWVVFFLFFMTGLAIVIYLNQTPVQPRERDYAYAGSFYAFAIWCGIGVAGTIDMLGRMKLKGVVPAIVVGLASLGVPVLMACQNWDDHDRSGRYMCRDFGQNYLMSLQDNNFPIIFTNGDNDTFPLWYDQETEGIRTDARVCNLSYLQTDWYIDQMKRPAYNSPAVPITWPRINYESGTNDWVIIDPSGKQQILDFYRQNPEEARKQLGDDPFEISNIFKYWLHNENPDMRVIPTDTLHLKVDKEAVRRSGMFMPSDTIPDIMEISLAGRRGLSKSDIMLLEMLVQCNWTRPMYVATTVGSENFMSLGENFVCEGLTNRITPFKTNVEGVRNFDTERVYKNLMTRFKFGGLNKKGLYLDWTIMRMCYTHRRLFGELALNLITEGKNAKALEVLDRAEKEIPAYNVPINYSSGGFEFAKVYIIAGNKAKAKVWLDETFKNAEQYVKWYLSLNDNRFSQSYNDCMNNLYIMNKCIEIADAFGENYKMNLQERTLKLGDVFRSRAGIK
ncbi:protein O-mannosyl-transferase family [Prevotella koreensis]|uniref:DUF2723 domain-containing protein n=1 Tax=Prevotella koreensis TaxID=2490854 RepID=A0A3S0P7Q9_9BACT|nr:DUF2723 domain-containing protein [Prevotella koreensis]RUL58914.1 DUF2723 domain-containing protein [Prevotella koreensis]